MRNVQTTPECTRSVLPGRGGHYVPFSPSAIACVCFAPKLFCFFGIRIFFNCSSIFCFFDFYSFPTLASSSTSLEARESSRSKLAAARALDVLLPAAPSDSQGRNPKTRRKNEQKINNVFPFPDRTHTTFERPSPATPVTPATPCGSYVITGRTASRRSSDISPSQSVDFLFFLFLLRLTPFLSLIHLYFFSIYV